MESRKLLDIGLERINSMLIDMAELSELTVSKSISAYTDEKDVLSEVLENSRKLKSRTGQWSVRDFNFPRISRAPKTSTRK